jgi:hypothetical protein
MARKCKTEHHRQGCAQHVTWAAVAFHDAIVATAVEVKVRCPETKPTDGGVRHREERAENHHHNAPGHQNPKPAAHRGVQATHGECGTAARLSESSVCVDDDDDDNNDKDRIKRGG